MARELAPRTGKATGSSTSGYSLPVFSQSHCGMKCAFLGGGFLPGCLKFNKSVGSRENLNPAERKMLHLLPPSAAAVPKLPETRNPRKDHYKKQYLAASLSTLRCTSTCVCSGSSSMAFRNAARSDLTASFCALCSADAASQEASLLI